MTDIVLSSRQTTGAVARPAPAPAMSLSEVERVCNMIATGGEMVPKCYQGKPGAVYLTLMWARKHNVDELTAIQNVYPIQGRTFVGADLRVQLAVDRGFDIETLRSDEQACLLRVTDPAGRVKTVAAVMPGATPPDADIVLTIPDEDAKKAMYSTRRSDMVYAAACRVADRRVFKSAAALVDAAQDYTDEPDAATALESAVDQAQGAIVPIEPEPDEAELIEEEPEPATAEAISDHVSADDLLSAASIKGLSRPKLLRHAQLVLNWSGGTIDDIVADQHVATLLLAAIGAGEVQ